MSQLEWVGVPAFGGGGLLLAAAWVFRLWWRAARFPKVGRWRVVGLMAARRAYRLVPARQTVVIAAVMGWGFVAGASGFATVWILGLRYYASTLPVVTEAYEGFGDAVALVLLAGTGLLLAPMAGLIVMAVVVDFVHRRMERGRRDD
jgi:hypothetical protein